MHKIFYNSRYKKLTMRTGLFCSFDKTFSYRLWSVFSRYAYFAFTSLWQGRAWQQFQVNLEGQISAKKYQPTSVAVFWPDLIQHVKEA